MILAGTAVVLRRPDLLVLAAPLFVALLAGRQAKPTHSPVVRQGLGNRSLTEGEATTYRMQIDEVAEVDGEGQAARPRGAETVAAVLEPQRLIELSPADGQLVALANDRAEPSVLELVVRPTRWGNHSIREPLIIATSSWGSYRWTAPRRGATQHLQALPRAANGSGSPSTPASAPGLVGSHRSPRHGTGVEFANIRPFVAGDRLHRIRWPHSLRTGTLHVASTWADQDRHVVLIVDAVVDVGRSAGVGGAPSSLDITVRAAAALAEHHVGQGDRVSLVTVGSQRRDHLPPATGPRHVRRVLSTLAAIEPAGVLVGPDRIPKNLGRGSLVIILSPLRTPWALARAVAMSSQGLVPVVVDCLPPDLENRPELNPHEAAAWRIERMRRDHEARRAGERGVPVVPWRSPADLERVVRDMHRHRRVRSGWSA